MIPVVIVAGGRGLRLHPLTETRPKPMLKVGGRPILEQIIDGFSTQGFKKFWLCVNYKSELIVKHFGNGESRGINIKYIHETEPLGTAGALRLIPPFAVPFIVCNGDVLSKINYAKLMDFHVQSNADLTMCAALHQYQVPYGVAQIGDENRLTELQEKPIENWAVNAGIYVLEPRALDRAPHGRFDMTDLINHLTNVAVYQIDGMWIDVGRFESLNHANQEWPS